MKPALILERALFVVAPGDSGKSTQLRSMFRDRRLGTNGRIPSSSEATKLREIYHLSNERRLYLRLTSPHERRETPREFLKKTRHKMDSGRWCFACPFQPNAFRNMPDVLDSVLAFMRAFDPERVRVVFLSPNRHGVELEEYFADRDIRRELLRIDGVEVVCMDGREREVNGLFLADFFDFT